MKRHWIDYQDDEPILPMTFWVHRAVGDVEVWRDAQDFDPPRQPQIPGKGYPIFRAEFDGFIFAFTSLAEIEACIAVLEQKLLPRTFDLSRARGTEHGPNAHWLSRLPTRTKSWRYRQRAVPYLREALQNFKKAMAKP